MRELDDAALERRLREVLKERLGALPLDLTVDALDRRREAKGVARRSGRGRGITLFAAAALLLVGGALAAGSGILRLPSVVPPVPEPSVIAVATASPDATSPSPSESAAPSASPIPVAGPGGALDRHRDDGHASLWKRSTAAPRWPGARGGWQRGRDPNCPPRSCTTRPAGHGQPPGACSRAWPASRPRCCATAGCSLGIRTTSRQMS